MKPIQIINGRAVPLNRSNIDTDQIIPSDWLKQIERTGFERGLFSQWRDEPDFILNHEQYMGAKILLAGENFGIGSSREHAVWAIQQYGFQAVISSSFGDIFKNNSTKNGLLTVVLSEDSVQILMSEVETNPGIEFLVSVDTLTIEVPEIDFKEPFFLAPGIQERILNGLDDIDLSLKHGEKIDSFEETRPIWMK